MEFNLNPGDDFLPCTELIMGVQLLEDMEIMTTYSSASIGVVLAAQLAASSRSQCAQHSPSRLLPHSFSSLKDVTLSKSIHLKTKTSIYPHSPQLSLCLRHPVLWHRDSFKGNFLGVSFSLFPHVFLHVLTTPWWAMLPPHPHELFFAHVTTTHRGDPCVPVWGIWCDKVLGRERDPKHRVRGSLQRGTCGLGLLRPSWTAQALGAWWGDNLQLYLDFWICIYLDLLLSSPAKHKDTQREARFLTHAVTSLGRRKRRGWGDSIFPTAGLQAPCRGNQGLGGSGCLHAQLPAVGAALTLGNKYILLLFFFFSFKWKWPKTNRRDYFSAATCR